jgi:hypothetical protein
VEECICVDKYAYLASFIDELLVDVCDVLKPV